MYLFDYGGPAPGVAGHCPFTLALAGTLALYNGRSKPSYTTSGQLYAGEPLLLPSSHQCQAVSLTLGAFMDRHYEHPAMQNTLLFYTASTKRLTIKALG